MYCEKVRVLVQMDVYWSVYSKMEFYRSSMLVLPVDIFAAVDMDIDRKNINEDLEETVFILLLKKLRKKEHGTNDIYVLCAKDFDSVQLTFLIELKRTFDC
ncbi:hypothetical protein GLOIN_2v1494244 [Rhizophagus irregularis DAOM 181602=DAOM 197198]|nr:hypothetical protein GLOIN_2v1494244 [Rhizophagus irregularis DAOM 181602=DAOM 197198]